jgi:NTE family protein
MAAVNFLKSNGPIDEMSGSMIAADGYVVAASPANGSRSGRRRLALPLTVRRQPTSMAVLLVAAFGAFLAFLDSTIVNIAFPNIQKSFPTYTISKL